MRLVKFVSECVHVALGNGDHTFDPVEQAGQVGRPFVDRIHGPSEKRLDVMGAVSL